MVSDEAAGGAAVRAEADVGPPDIAEQVHAGAVKAFTGMAGAFHELRAELLSFGYALHESAATEYLRHHSRLPGGIGNARLIKKRRDMVMRWFIQHMQSNDADKATERSEGRT